VIRYEQGRVVQNISDSRDVRMEEEVGVRMDNVVLAGSTKDMTGQFNRDPII
jgi:hypothetical protein